MLKVSIFAAGLAACAAISDAVSAATVTTNEAELDAIFSQPGFAEPIDIRFLETIRINGP